MDINRLSNQTGCCSVATARYITATIFNECGRIFFVLFGKGVCGEVKSL